MSIKSFYATLLSDVLSCQDENFYYPFVITTTPALLFSKIVLPLIFNARVEETGADFFSSLFKVPVKMMTSWTVDEVCSWLSSLSLEQYCEGFRENEIDGTELFNISAETLANDLCIGMFHFGLFVL